jgi:hypothetical protein
MGYLLSPPILGQISQHAGWAAMWGTAAVAAGLVAVLAGSGAGARQTGFGG